MEKKEKRQAVNPIIDLNEATVSADDIINSDQLFSYFHSDVKPAMVPLTTPFDESIRTIKILSRQIDNIKSDKVFSDNVDMINHELANNLISRLSSTIRHNLTYVFNNGFKNLIESYLDRSLKINAIVVAEPNPFAYFSFANPMYDVMYRSFVYGEPSNISVTDLAQLMLSELVTAYMQTYSDWYAKTIDFIIKNEIIDIEDFGNIIYKSEYMEELEPKRRFAFGVSILSEQANKDMETLRGIISTNCIQTISEYINNYRFDNVIPGKARINPTIEIDASKDMLPNKNYYTNKKYYNAIPELNESNNEESKPNFIIRKFETPEQFEEYMNGNISKNEIPVVYSTDSFEEFQKTMKDKKFGDNILGEF